MTQKTSRSPTTRGPHVRVVLASLSFYQDETAPEHAVATQGLHVLRLYALRSDILKRHCRIQVGRLNFRDKHLLKSGAPLERWNALLEPLPDVLGLTCEPWSLTFVEDFVASVRRRHPGVRIWIGGDYARHLVTRRRVAFQPEDIVFPWGAGFVEFPFRAALETLVTTGGMEDGDYQRIPGVIRFASDGTAIETGPPTYVPIAQRPQYFEDPTCPSNFIYDYFHLRVSWGCSLRCRFCTFWRSKVPGRGRVDHATKDQIELGLRYAREMGYRKIWLDATHLNDSPAFMTQILRDVDDGSFDHIRVFLMVERLDRDQLEFLSSLGAGRFEFELGIQSLSPIACRAIRRRCFPAAALREMLSPLAQRQRVSLDYIYPLPGEGRIEVQRHVEELLAIPGIQVRLNQLLLPAGSDFGDEPSRFGYTVEDVDGYPFAAASEWFPREDMEAMLDWIEEVRRVHGNRLEPTTVRNWIDHRGAAEKPAGGSSLPDASAGIFGPAVRKRVLDAVQQLVQKHPGVSLVRHPDRFEVCTKSSPDVRIVIEPFVKGKSYFLQSSEVGLYYIAPTLDGESAALIRDLMAILNTNGARER